jgi:hypothetical protein
MFNIPGMQNVYTLCACVCVYYNFEYTDSDYNILYTWPMKGICIVCFRTFKVYGTYIVFNALDWHMVCI